MYQSSTPLGLLDYIIHFPSRYRDGY